MREKMTNKNKSMHTMNPGELTAEFDRIEKDIAELATHLDGGSITVSAGKSEIEKVFKEDQKFLAFVISKMMKIDGENKELAAIKSLKETVDNVLSVGLM